MDIILASGSPRRKELLEKMEVKFKVHVSNVEEVITSTQPDVVVMELSGIKARAVYEECKSSEGDNDYLVIGADTVVACDGEIIGKPKDIKDAARMLNMLSGREHQVYTGVTIIIRQEGVRKEISFAECSKVFVCPLTDQEIIEYIASGEPADKAGAYAIQGLFAPYIEKIEGDYYNIVGFPISRIYQELKKSGIILGK